MWKMCKRSSNAPYHKSLYTTFRHTLKTSSTTIWTNSRRQYAGGTSPFLSASIKTVEHFCHGILKFIIQLGWDSPSDEEQISILLLLDAVLKLHASKQTIKQFKVLVSCLLSCLRHETAKWLHNCWKNNFSTTVKIEDVIHMIPLTQINVL